MNTISVPRELLERIIRKMNIVWQKTDETEEIRALLSAPAVDGELEALLFLDEGDGIKIPLCSLPKAQAIIDQLKEESRFFYDKLSDAEHEQEQQAARIAELQKDADRYRWIEANSTYGIDYRQRPELTLPIYAPDHREGLDAAIDKAIGEKHE